MDKFTQLLQPVADNIYISALVALIPIVYYLVALAGFKLKAWVTGLTTLIVAIVIAIVFFKMPAGFAVMSSLQGIVYGIIPIGWIILTSVFLYKMTVKTGHFNIIRDSVTSLTDDRRIQALLIAFSFGAFLEGAAGFGAPVAITAALLVGLGFKPLYAAGICLLANTAPVAFGAVGVPVTAIGNLTTYADGSPIPATDIARMIGHQLPLVSIFIPFYLVFVMAGFKKTIEILPALLVSGGSFALAQFLSASFMGPELPDIVSSLFSLICTVILLKFWKPKTTWKFSDEPKQSITQVKHSNKDIFIAWAPFVVLVFTIFVWTLAPVKAFFKNFVLHPAVPLIHNNIINSVSHKAVAAEFKLDILGATGTAILTAAIIGKFIIKISWKDTFATFVETFREIRLALLTICFVVGFAYVMNASGMTNTLGSALAATGKAFAFFSAALGWTGVFITGSDTSANLLFAKLQQVTAQQTGMDPLLAVAANASGGVTGKMISPQSIAVAAASVGLVGKEPEILRFTVKHSIILLLMVCCLVYLQSTGLLSWMIPVHP
ncbi:MULTISPECIES: L-lactate permease [unclassified Gemella]|uniref:L-lactate permease n=1 Tax=unclassified Gemella TaxID=2624949 RepID=UPI001C051F38|nr:MULTISPECIES: L-lactate permease [unclassified Gemella]MBU0278905.1 L-lactate permease [Gemella sp. zg-1178]QWQ38461.1 L-lactate permease [Gemella sp. zg-570]